MTKRNRSYTVEFKREVVAFKVTTKRKHSDAVADNLLNQNFNPVAPNQAWAGDVTYLRTGQG